MSTLSWPRTWRELTNVARGQKLVVGTQMGILSIFNRKSGYGDCVDRIPGHPHSIDALCTIPSHYPNAQSTILTGSSDGLLRAVQILPTKLLGVVADHGEFPIERIAVDRGGEGTWVGSVGHEEVLKLTDLREVFEDEGEGDEEEIEDDDEEEGGEDAVELQTAASDGVKGEEDEIDVDSEAEGGEEDEDEDEDGDGQGKGDAEDESSSDSSEEEDAASVENKDAEAETGADEDSSDEEVPEQKKRKRKKDTDPFQIVKKSKGRNEMDGDTNFFADL